MTGGRTRSFLGTCGVEQCSGAGADSAEQAIGDRMTLLGNRILLAEQQIPMEPVEL